MQDIKIDLDTLKNEKKEIEDFLSLANAFSDPSFKQKNKRLIELNDLIELETKKRKLLADIKDSNELLSDPEMADLAKETIAETENELTDINEKIFIILTPKDPNDDKDIIMEIRAGAGGDEASLFAAELTIAVDIKKLSFLLKVIHLILSLNLNQVYIACKEFQPPKVKDVFIHQQSQ